MNEQTEIVANDGWLSHRLYRVWLQVLVHAVSMVFYADLIREHSFDDPQAKGDDKRCADELKNQFDSAEMESLTSCDEVDYLW